MKSAKVIFLFLLVTSVAFGGGYWVARRNPAPADATISAPMTAETPAAASAANISRPRVRNAAEPLADAKGGKPLLADIEAKIREMTNGGFGFRNKNFRDWQKLVDSMDPADIPAVLALLDKVGTKNTRDGLRSTLLAKWAETDVAGALAYSSAIVNKQSRDNAIRTVVGIWAETDSTAAMAWMQQLPPGQMRNQVLGAMIGPLAAKDPQAAFDLMKSEGGNNQSRWGGMYQLSALGPTKTRRPR